MNFLQLGCFSTLALANALVLVVGIAARADDIEAPETPTRVFLSSAAPISFPLEEDDFAPGFGIQKGVGVQVVKPVEVNDHKYELKLGGPLVKSGSKKKSLGLKFELRF